MFQSMTIQQIQTRSAQTLRTIDLIDRMIWNHDNILTRECRDKMFALRHKRYGERDNLLQLMFAMEQLGITKVES